MGVHICMDTELLHVHATVGVHSIIPTNSHDTCYAILFTSGN